MKILVIITTALGLCALSFWSGYKWKESHLGTAKKYILGESINLWNSDSGVTGKLPKGSYLYDAGDPKSNKYYVFINISGEEVLLPYNEKKYNLIIPIEGSNQQ